MHDCDIYHKLLSFEYLYILKRMCIYIFTVCFYIYFVREIASIYRSSARKVTTQKYYILTIEAN